MKKWSLVGIALLAGTSAQAATIVDFETFRIRNNNGSITSPWDGNLYIEENSDGDGFVAGTPDSGQKVGYGTDAFEGFRINELNEVNWLKPQGAGHLTAYLNIWVKDNDGNFAVIASENNYRGEDLSSASWTEWKIFEFGGPSGSNLSWLFDSGVGSRINDDTNALHQYLLRDGARISLTEISDEIVVFGGMPYGTLGVGTGAPQGGFGFNIIWGDTSSNFITGNPYEVDNVTVKWGDADYAAGKVAVVPVPAAAPLGLVGMGLIAFLRRRKKAVAA